jgi:hypothetical protein
MRRDAAEVSGDNDGRIAAKKMMRAYQGIARGMGALGRS